MSAQDQEWGPWTVHDGLGCPVPPGTIVEVRFKDAFGYASTTITMAMGGAYSSWNWDCFPKLKKILRYRVRRPKGLMILDVAKSKIDSPKVTGTSPRTKQDA